VCVPPDDAPAIAHAIRRLIDAPSELDAMRATIPAVKSIEDDADQWRRRYAALLPRAAAAAC
jgi:hypothetical protein